MQQAVRKMTPPPIKDVSLFRQQCYINGKWADADSKRTVEVHVSAAYRKLDVATRVALARFALAHP